MLTELKQTKGHKWLNDAPNVCLQQSLRCLETAYSKFFSNKKVYPKFKSKHKSRHCAKHTENGAFARQIAMGVPSVLKHPSRSGAEDMETHGCRVCEASRLEIPDAL